MGESRYFGRQVDGGNEIKGDPTSASLGAMAVAE